MDYIELNGVKSNTIKGLLIQSLPSISKPLQRAQIEEIDGRDGDIVTKLGYSAYDKTIVIGLHGDYDIDDAIQYFDSEGIVTFSNEPDKYYKYVILEQIDFEKLIRFKVATVTFHVQPFKYSAVENDFTFSNDSFHCQNYIGTNNGVTITVNDGIISVTGTAVVATEIYVPVQNVRLNAGNYTLNARVTGLTGNACSIRLIKSAPSNAESFGGNYLSLLSNANNVQTQSITQTTQYNYLWFYINPKQAMSFTMDVAVINNDFNSVSIRNIGNIYARPRITLYGNGTVNLSVNGKQLFAVNLDGNITIDASEMNAYKGGVLANRSVTGNYDNLILNVGKNTVSWSGSVTKIEIENYTRWI